MVNRTQQFHRLVPVSKSKLHAYKLSHQSTPPELVSVQGSNEDMTELSIIIPQKSRNKTTLVVCMTITHGCAN